jgi:hypothetical protein
MSGTVKYAKLQRMHSEIMECIFPRFIYISLGILWDDAVYFINSGFSKRQNKVSNNEQTVSIFMWFLRSKCLK